MTETIEQRTEATQRLLADSCHDWGIVLAGDRSVTESDAERLLGYRPGTLRAQRTEGTCRIPRRLVGNRWRYRLSDLAQYLEAGYNAA
ncbi:helix-turn-helix transcriptional regulator [Pseudomonas syringae]|uniref:helix-turn-helix transcriptional regulator n=1 Tax=Pseudomonas syringae TaxID=317 RepID=UPI00352F6DEE